MRAAEEVDLLLVLSSDVSRSIDAPKFKLQRDGYAAAIGAQKIVIDWTIIHDEATAKDFSAQVIEARKCQQKEIKPLL
jgi:hypothetical protein